MPALQALKEDYRETDSRVAQEFGSGAAITDDGGAGGFSDVASAVPSAPSSGGAELPEVSFGAIFDTVCDVIAWIGGPDPREYVTRWIVGDMGKAGIARLVVGGSERGAQGGRAQPGRRARPRSARPGRARRPPRRRPRSTSGSPRSASRPAGMSQVGRHMVDMIGQALDMAQVVVDIIKTVISMVSAALAGASIPIFGQAKLIKTVKDAIVLINNARKVITVFWNALVMIKDAFDMVVERLRGREAPAGPEHPLRAARGNADDRATTTQMTRSAPPGASCSRRSPTPGPSWTACGRSPVLNADERRELHWQALSGVLGRDMQTLARHVEARETSVG